MNAIEQAIVDMIENNTVVTSAELIAMLTGSSIDSTPSMDVVTAENMILAIDKAVAEFADNFPYDETETKEENYRRTDEIISVLEATREYFECVLEYAECFE